MWKISGMETLKTNGNFIAIRLLKYENQYER